MYRLDSLWALLRYLDAGETSLPKHSFSFTHPKIQSKPKSRGFVAYRMFSVVQGIRSYSSRGGGLVCRHCAAMLQSVLVVATDSGQTSNLGSEFQTHRSSREILLQIAHLPSGFDRASTALGCTTPCHLFWHIVVNSTQRSQRELLI